MTEITGSVRRGLYLCMSVCLYLCICLFVCISLLSVHTLGKWIIID